MVIGLYQVLHLQFISVWRVDYVNGDNSCASVFLHLLADYLGGLVLWADPESEVV